MSSVRQSKWRVSSLKKGMASAEFEKASGECQRVVRVEFENASVVFEKTRVQWRVSSSQKRVSCS